MNVWGVIGIIIGILAAASWGIAIPATMSLWKNLRKAKQDYDQAMADGIITDAERIELANDIMAAITDASTIFQFLANLVIAILKVIKVAKARVPNRRIVK